MILNQSTNKKTSKFEDVVNYMKNLPLGSFLEIANNIDKYTFNTADKEKILKIKTDINNFFNNNTSNRFLFEKLELQSVAAGYKMNEVLQSIDAGISATLFSSSILKIEECEKVNIDRAYAVNTSGNTTALFNDKKHDVAFLVLIREYCKQNDIDIDHNTTLRDVIDKLPIYWTLPLLSHSCRSVHQSISDATSLIFNNATSVKELSFGIFKALMLKNLESAVNKTTLEKNVKLLNKKFTDTNTKVNTLEQQAEQFQNAITRLQDELSKKSNGLTEEQKKNIKELIDNSQQNFLTKGMFNSFVKTSLVTKTTFEEHKKATGAELENLHTKFNDLSNKILTLASAGNTQNQVPSADNSDFKDVHTKIWERIDNNESQFNRAEAAKIQDKLKSYKNKENKIDYDVYDFFVNDILSDVNRFTYLKNVVLVDQGRQYVIGYQDAEDLKVKANKALLTQVGLGDLNDAFFNAFNGQLHDSKEALCSIINGFNLDNQDTAEKEKLQKVRDILNTQNNNLKHANVLEFLSAVNALEGESKTSIINIFEATLRGNLGIGKKFINFVSNIFTDPSKITYAQIDSAIENKKTLEKYLQMPTLQRIHFLDVLQSVVFDDALLFDGYRSNETEVDKKVREIQIERLKYLHDNKDLLPDGAIKETEMSNLLGYNPKNFTSSAIIKIVDASFVSSEIYEFLLGTGDGLRQKIESFKSIKANKKIFDNDFIHNNFQDELKELKYILDKIDGNSNYSELHTELDKKISNISKSIPHGQSTNPQDIKNQKKLALLQALKGNSTLLFDFFAKDTGMGEEDRKKIEKQFQDVDKRYEDIVKLYNEQQSHFATFQNQLDQRFHDIGSKYEQQQIELDGYRQELVNLQADYKEELANLEQRMKSADEQTRIALQHEINVVNQNLTNLESKQDKFQVAQQKINQQMQAEQALINNRIEAQNQLIQSYQTQLEKLELDMVSASQEQKQLLQEQRKELEDKLAKETEERKNFEDQQSKLYNKLQQDYTELKNEQNALKEEQIKLKAVQEELKLKQADIENSLIEKQKQLEELKTRMEDATEEQKKELEKTKDDLQQKINEQKNTLEEVQKQQQNFEDKQSELNQKLQQDYATLNNQQNDLKNQQHEIFENVKFLRGTYQELNENNKQNIAALSKLQASLVNENVNKEETQREIEKLNDIIFQNNNQMNALQNQIVNNNTNIEKLTQEHGLMQANLFDLVGKYNALENQVFEKQKEIERLASNQNLTDTEKENINKQQKELSDLQDKMRQLEFAKQKNTSDELLSKILHAIENAPSFGNKTNNINSKSNSHEAPVENELTLGNVGGGTKKYVSTTSDFVKTLPSAMSVTDAIFSNVFSTSDMQTGGDASEMQKVKSLSTAIRAIYGYHFDDTVILEALQSEAFTYKNYVDLVTKSLKHGKDQGALAINDVGINLLTLSVINPINEGLTPKEAVINFHEYIGGMRDLLLNPSKGLRANSLSNILLDQRNNLLSKPVAKNAFIPDGFTEKMEDVITNFKSTSGLIITGKAGSGKTYTMEATLAKLGEKYGGNISAIKLEVGQIDSACGLVVGAVGQTVQEIIDAVNISIAAGQIPVLCIDEIHALFKGPNSPGDALFNSLKALMTDNKLILIGMTTEQEYNEFLRPKIDGDPALGRRFATVGLPEMPFLDTQSILVKKIKELYPVEEEDAKKIALQVMATSEIMYSNARPASYNTALLAFDDIFASIVKSSKDLEKQVAAYRKASHEMSSVKYETTALQDSVSADKERIDVIIKHLHESDIEVNNGNVQDLLKLYKTQSELTEKESSFKQLQAESGKLNAKDKDRLLKIQEQLKNVKEEMTKKMDDVVKGKKEDTKIRRELENYFDIQINLTSNESRLNSYKRLKTKHEKTIQDAMDNFEEIRQSDIENGSVDLLKPDYEILLRALKEKNPNLVRKFKKDIEEEYLSGVIQNFHVYLQHNIHEDKSVEDMRDFMLKLCLEEEIKEEKEEKEGREVATKNKDTQVEQDQLDDFINTELDDEIDGFGKNEEEQIQGGYDKNEEEQTQDGSDKNEEEQTQDGSDKNEEEQTQDGYNEEAEELDDDEDDLKFKVVGSVVSLPPDFSLLSLEQLRGMFLPNSKLQEPDLSLDSRSVVQESAKSQ